MSNITKHSVVIGGHKTSVSLERPFWNGIKALADARDMTISALIGEIDEAREPGTNLASALRLAVLAAAQAAAGDIKHRKAA